MKKLLREDLKENFIGLLTDGFVVSFGDDLVECLFYDNTTKRYYHVQSDIRKDTETKKGYQRDEFVEFISQNWIDEFDDFMNQAQQKMNLL